MMISFIVLVVCLDHYITCAVFFKNIFQFFLTAVKNVPPKSERCCAIVQTISARGVRCHFRLSNNGLTAKCSKSSSISFKTIKIQLMEKAGLMWNIEKWDSNSTCGYINLARTLCWQNTRLSWKGLKRSWKQRAQPNRRIGFRSEHQTSTLQSNPTVCTLLTYLNSHKSANRRVTIFFVFTDTLYSQKSVAGFHPFDLKLCSEACLITCFDYSEKDNWMAT